MPDFDFGYPDDEFFDIGDNEWHGGSENFPDDSQIVDWGIGGGGDFSSPFDFGGSLNSLLKALGLGGGSGLSNLLALLGAGYGAYNLNKATSGASEKLQAAADKSGAKATELLTGAQANFSPYITAGHNALAQLEALGARPLADKFTSTGAKLDSLGSFDKYLTLAKLAKTKGK